MIKRKILALALAGALACPQVAFAARDGDGMEYVSAAEGFYGSLRTRYTSTDGKANNNSKIRGSTSRLGVRGTLDIGHGLTGLYRYEFGVGADNGGNLNTRLHYVGLKGNFGEVQAGALWGNGYNWVTSATDIATSGSGNFAAEGIADFRSNNSLQYTSPNLNGFQGSFRVEMDGNSDKENLGDDNALGGTGDNADTAPSENVDEWAVSAKYGVRGFTVAGVYQVQPDGARPDKNGPTDAPNGIRAAAEDVNFWALRGGYGQDNWAVNAWYGQHNTSDTVAPNLGADNAVGGTAANADRQPDDTTVFSVGGNIDVGKVALVIIHENLENEWGRTNTATVFNVDYRFTSKSRVWGAYVAKDYDTDTTVDDEIHIGLRMDF